MKFVLQATCRRLQTFGYSQQLSRLIVGIIAAASMELAPIQRAGAISYTITPVASVGAELTGLLSQDPQMSETGEALFMATLPGNIQAVLVGNGGPLTSVTTWTEAPRVGIDGSTLGGSQSNALGEVVFLGGPGGSTESIYIWHHGVSPQPLYNSTCSPSQSFRFSFEPSINNQGMIAFVASGQGLPSAVFVGDRNGTFPTTALAATGGPIYEGFSVLQQPEISNSGTVFVRGTKNGVVGVYKLTGPGTSIPIAQVGPQFSSVSSADVNSFNVAAFLATSVGGQGGIYVGNENGLTTIATDVGDLRITNEPGINDFGNVIFRAQLRPPGNELDILLTGPDLVANKLIGEGDLLFGEPVTAVFAGRGSINNAGQIAFYAQRRNLAGQLHGGIYIATPVPEPNGWSIIWLGMAVIMAKDITVSRVRFPRSRKPLH